MRMNEPLWYVPGSDKYTPEAFDNFWTTLAKDFSGSKAVIGADLHNEPHNDAAWKSGAIKTRSSTGGRPPSRLGTPSRISIPTGSSS